MIIEMVQALVDKGYAYAVESGSMGELSASCKMAWSAGLTLR